MTTLLQAVRRYAEAHADKTGRATVIQGLAAAYATSPSDLARAVARPLVCIVVQGAKEMTTGPRTFAFQAGDSLLITADVPTVSRITRASAAEPYLALVLELDSAIIAELASAMEPAPSGQDAPVRVEPTDVEVSETAFRLLRLLDRPAAAAALQASLLRELHYWLMAGRHGAAIRRLGWPNGHSARIARAATLLRAEFDRPLRVERLAAEAGMSPSAFHQHFRATTSLSPLQFQKHLRLIEARRRMLSDAVSASSAAFAVGYESVPQFTREYGRMFGASPARDVQAARRGLLVAA